MTKTRQRLGQRGEKLATEHLLAQGYRILARNVRYPAGELDIVAQDGSYLVFVEVRTRRGRNYGSPEESVTRTKQAKLIEVARTYLQEHELHDVDWRIDVVAVELAPDGRLLRVEVIKDAVHGPGG